MNKPKDDPRKKLDEVLSRFLGNEKAEEDSELDEAEFDDIEVNTDKD